MKSKVSISVKTTPSLWLVAGGISVVGLLIGLGLFVAFNTGSFSNSFATPPSEALNGTYVVGSSSEEYKTISDAVGAVLENGIGGDVVFEIEQGEYEENLILGEEFTGSHKVTFKGNGMVTIASSEYAVVGVNGSKNVHFESIYFEQTGSEGAVIDLRNVLNVTFEKNTFTSSQTVAPICSGNFESNLQFVNNTFSGGEIGLDLMCNTSLNSGLLVTNNSFTNQSRGAITITSANAANVSRNMITSTSSFGNYVALNLVLSGNGLTVAGNRILPQAGQGIVIFAAPAESGALNLVFNNIIHIKGASNWSSQLLGAQIVNSNNVKFYYNSVKSGSAVNQNSAALEVSGINVGLEVVNNIFVNAGNGYALLFESESPVTRLDFNNYYHPAGMMMKYGTNNFFSLSIWSANSGLDNSSLSLDPQFISEDELLFGNEALVEKGTPLEGISIDINEEGRSNSTPNIGAYEVLQLKEEAGEVMGISRKDIDVPTLTLYPNPVKTNFTVTISTQRLPEGDFSVMDLQGKEVIIGQVENGDEQIEVDASELSNGSYIFMFKGEDQVISEKFVVTK